MTQNFTLNITNTTFNAITNKTNTTFRLHNYTTTSFVQSYYSIAVYWVTYGLTDEPKAEWEISLSLIPSNSSMKRSLTE